MCQPFSSDFPYKIVHLKTLVSAALHDEECTSDGENVLFIKVGPDSPTQTRMLDGQLDGPDDENHQPTIASHAVMKASVVGDGK